MTYNTVISLAAAILTFVGVLPLSAQNQATVSNIPQADGGVWGTSQIDTYDVAVHLDSDLFGGLELKEFAFGVDASANISGCKMWLSKELTVSNKVNVADAGEYTASRSGDRLSVVLPEAYTIADGGVYIGVTFTIDKREGDSDRKPILTAPLPDAYKLGFWAHTGKTYPKWTNVEANAGAVPQVEMTFGNIVAASASMVIPAEIPCAVGKDIVFDALLTNYGSEPPASLGIAYTIGDNAYNTAVEVPAESRPGFLATAPVRIVLPAVDSKGEYSFSAKITTVNGKDNTRVDESKATLSCLSHMPVNRPLMEEYSGTGCGYCPRGDIGVEKMEELYGDRFVAATYHCADIMSVIDIEDYPNPAPSQPTSWLNRSIQADPYFGLLSTNSKQFGINQLWEQMAAEFTPADLSVSCELNADATALDIRSDFTFVKDYDAANFRMVYLVLADGMTGEGIDWLQGNYYSGQTGKWPEAFDFLVESPRYIQGWVYNNVVVYTSGKAGLEGSVPAEIKADEALSHSYSVDLADCVNLKGENLIQNKEKLHVVALILDTASGRVINSADSSNGSASVGEVEVAAKTVVSEQYYNLQGQPVSSDSRGLLIRRTTYSDGSAEGLVIRR